eukprot:1190190-Prorocentrum_minimum.AAC.2
MDHRMGTAVGRPSLSHRPGARSATRLRQLAMPRDVIAMAGADLAGTSWLLTMDIGRERNTWMDPTWAASGRRMEIPILVTLEAGGRVQVRVARNTSANQQIIFLIKP